MQNYRHAETSSGMHFFRIESDILVSTMPQHEGGKLAKLRGQRIEVLRVHKVLTKQFWTMRVCDNAACRVLTGVPACYRPLNWKSNAWFKLYRSAVENAVKESQAKNSSKTKSLKPKIVKIKMKKASGDDTHEMFVEGTWGQLSVEATIENISFVASHMG